MGYSLLIAAYKPPFISSNAYLSSLKKHFQCKKGGYLGTLDPFAQGTLVVGFGSYTRLFAHLHKAPKVYRATLWLGAHSRSLDIENMMSIALPKAYPQSDVESAVASVRGKILYAPPQFSAKHIKGKRAYQLARAGIDFELAKVQMDIYNIQFLSYCHPFVSFEVSVSEGSYVRSIGEMIAQRLGTNGALSYLERISEGEMSVTSLQGVKILNPLDYLPYPKLERDCIDVQDMYFGRKITLKNIQKGKYIVCFDDFFSIIEVCENGNVEYILNRIEYAHSLTQTR